MKLKVKKLDEKAVLPIKAHANDAGMDLTAIKITTELSEDNRLIIVYHTGLSIEIPTGHVGLLFPRSSISRKSLILTNSVGVIDSGYRGEVMAKFKVNTDVVPAIYREGERFIQLVIIPIPEVEVEEVEELTETERGDGGFGSSNESTETVETAKSNEAANEL